MDLLQKLLLDGNLLYGKIPLPFSKVSKLIELHLEGKDFTGVISVLELPFLRSFNVSNNNLQIGFMIFSYYFLSVKQMLHLEKWVPPNGSASLFVALVLTQQQRPQSSIHSSSPSAPPCNPTSTRTLRYNPTPTNRFPSPPPAPYHVRLLSSQAEAAGPGPTISPRHGLNISISLGARPDLSWPIQAKIHHPRVSAKPGHAGCVKHHANDCTEEIEREVEEQAQPSCR